MPKPATYTLAWSPDRDSYEMYEQHHHDYPLLRGDDESWFAWLAAHSAFSFQGKHGQLNLLKEDRQRGRDGYWYAYRRQGRRMVKKYAGRSGDLTMARLEATANALSGTSRPVSEVALVRSAAARVSLSATASVDEPSGAVRQQGPKQFSESAAPNQAPLLEPKLHLPRPQASLVVRERLLAQLDAGLERKLTLISAPAGFGKTTLVSQWLASREVRDLRFEAGEIARSATSLKPQAPSLKLAWLSLDTSDNDPFRFWRYVITACQAYQADLGHTAIALLATAPPSLLTPAPLEPILTTFLNALNRLSVGGILVLEDYHVIAEPRIHETLAFMIDHLPATLHVLLLTRSSPPLPLARWRARNDLHEVNAADLRFLPSETASFLEHTLAFRLAPEAIGQLDAHLEGWAAGLRLIALALQGHVPEKQIEQFLATFAGSHRHLLEYLVTEVLDAQPKSLQIFLLQTSMLGRLTGPLCDAVTGRNDSTRLLETVERAGLFLLHLGGTEPWYRYHMFFAEAMQHEAHRRLGADALRLCSSRASAWYEEHGMLVEAVDLALAANEWARAAVLIERFAELQQLTEHYEIYALQRWLEQLPKAVLHATPALCYIYAESLTFSSTSDRFAPTTLARVEAFLKIAEQGWRSEGNTSRLGKLFAFRALFVLLRRGDIARAAAFAGQALPWLSEAEASWRGVCVGIVGESERQAGQLDVARQMFLEARALCEASGNAHALRPVIIALGDVCRLQGQLHQAAEHYRQMLAESEDDPTDRAGALLGLAQLAYEWNDLDAAAQEANLALDLGRQIADMSLLVQASLVLARVQHARGATAQAQQTLQEVAARMPPARWPLLQREIRFWQAQWQLASEDYDAVQHWVSACAQDDASLPLLQREREELLVARWLLVQGQAEAAARLLDQWLVDAQAGGRTRSILEIQLLMVLAHLACKQPQAAQQTLQAVLAHAYAENYLRLFLDEDEPLASLLRASLPDTHEPAVVAYLQTLLHAFSDRRLQIVDSRLTPSQSTMVEPLSPQEQRVLRLLAAGLSNPEIAQELVVSVNTVKTHLQRIYQKLNVTSRREARAAARQFHLQ